MKKENKCICQPWVYIFLLNALAIHITSIIFPSLVVLGNNNIYPLAALVFTSLILTAVLSQIQTIAAFLKLKIKKNSWRLTYTAANILLLWLIARGAYYTGFGLTSFLIAIALGIVLSTVQSLVWKFA